MYEVCLCVKCVLSVCLSLCVWRGVSSCVLSCRVLSHVLHMSRSRARVILVFDCVCACVCVCRVCLCVEFVSYVCLVCPLFVCECGVLVCFVFF